MSWIWNELEEGRVKRAKSLKVSSITNVNGVYSGEFIGSKGDVYLSSLELCTCPDFAIKHGTMPCKHIIRLGMEAGYINQNGNTPEQQHAADVQELRSKIALAAGFFYVFNEATVSDKEYDQMKIQLEALTGETLHRAEEANKPFDLKEVVFFLQKRNLEFIDKTQNGGGLYFFDEKAAEELKSHGVKVQYAANGSRSTGNRPAWYIKSQK